MKASLVATTSGHKTLCIAQIAEFSRKWSLLICLISLISKIEINYKMRLQSPYHDVIIQYVITLNYLDVKL